MNRDSAKLDTDEANPISDADSARTRLAQSLARASIHEGRHGQVMSTEAAALALQDQAALWSMGEICATDVVTAACNALVAGLDSPALRMLAACTRAEATYDVPDLLPPALEELGLTLHPMGSVAGQEGVSLTSGEPSDK
ncbi:hypothetical protein QA942_37730 [Streptomyces sp. B21-106]|uniref:hypothetical protein n=2 Tax=Streptomyces TaxID=1883 RepID=UPI002FF08E30